ncbi:MAG TPA: PAS domain-containing protein [Alphaproteobacteria bacterium]|nr:PAS domain-containing protein [Alphaproteobacteria bacterium]
MRITSDIAEVADPKIRLLHAYWEELRAGRPAPARAELDPGRLRAILPYLIIVQFEREPFRVLYRLVGTRVAEVTGADITGRYLDEVAFREEADFQGCYLRAATEAVPVFITGVLSRDQWSDWTYDAGIFPLSDDGATVNKAIAVETYDRLESDPDRLLRLRGGR